MNAVELNRVLSDEIYKVRSGKAKTERANAVRGLASQIVATARLEFAYMKHFGSGHVGMAFLPPVKKTKEVLMVKGKGK